LKVLAEVVAQCFCCLGICHARPVQKVQCYMHHASLESEKIVLLYRYAFPLVSMPPSEHHATLPCVTEQLSSDDCTSDLRLRPSRLRRSRSPTTTASSNCAAQDSAVYQSPHKIVAVWLTGPDSKRPSNTACLQLCHASELLHASSPSSRPRPHGRDDPLFRPRTLESRSALIRLMMMS
jgi:hypothetical protein